MLSASLRSSRRSLSSSLERHASRSNRQSNYCRKQKHTLTARSTGNESTFLNSASQNNIKFSLIALCGSSRIWNPVRTEAGHFDEPAQIPAAPSAFSSISSPDSGLIHRTASRIKAFFKRLWETWIVSLRSTEIALRLSPLLVLGPAAVASSSLYASAEKNPISQLAWWYTVNQINALGPCFVKLAQWIATRRDLFSPNVCNNFAKFHDNGFTHSWAHTNRVLTKAFGDNYREQGLHVEKHDVIGSGSAAQVYRGHLVTSDQATMPVAIKVLHPKFEEWIESDLKFMESVARMLHNAPFLGKYVVYVNLPQVAQNFGKLLRLQADLRVEGRNLKRFRQNFFGHDERREKARSLASSVSFPKPIEGWVQSSVLVQELVEDFTPIGEYLRDETKDGLKVRKALAGPLLSAFLKMVFVDNFVHCDLHPGNVFVKTERTEDDSVKHKIVFIDTGIAMSLTPNDQKNLRDLFKAVVLNNGDKAGRLMVARARFEICSETEGCIDSFARGVEQIVREFHDRRKKGLTLGAVRIGSLLNQVLDLCRTHGVEVDPSMANIVISTLVLEGLGRSLEPELNLIDCAIPFILGRGVI